MNTEATLASKIQEIFKLLPLERAMSSLRASGEENKGTRELVSALSAPPEVLAGLWLYLDDLDRSHPIAQDIDTPTGSYWHGIIHRREGDFSNAKYWFRQVGEHPVIAQLDYNPFAFTDECEADKGQNSPKLVELQRREWKALFDWCLEQAGVV
jgi:hypothetical protein